MTNRYRLSSSTYEREEDSKIEPKKVFFLSVESNTTEKAYFQGVSSYRKQLGISAELSKIAGHGKSKVRFKENYLPNIDKAILRSKSFESDEEKLVDNIGCNIWKLIEKMKEYKD